MNKSGHITVYYLCIMEKELLVKIANFANLRMEQQGFMMFQLSSCNELFSKGKSHFAICLKSTYIAYFFKYIVFCKVVKA